MNPDKAPQDISRSTGNTIGEPINIIDDLRLPLLLGKGKVVETPEGLACRISVQGKFDKKTSKTPEIERDILLNQAELAKNGIQLVIDAGLHSGCTELRGDIWPVGENDSIQVEQVCIPTDIFDV